MVTNSLSTIRDSRDSQTGKVPLTHRSFRFARANGEPSNCTVRRARDGSAIDIFDHEVEISAPDFVRRYKMTWDDIAAEIVQVKRCEKIEFRFRGPLHLLVVRQEGKRREGTTFVEGLPRSALRDVRQKFTFVPAGHEYHDWELSHTPVRVMYFYFDPARMPLDREAGAAKAALAPRLYFEDSALWDTALKLTAAIESVGSVNRVYCEALAVVMAHEVVRFSAGSPPIKPPLRGGLATWQQRIVAAYIEQHLAEPTPLATLAQLVGLSPYYFCRAFKRSFGMPPHQYHVSRRIDRAKTLLARQAPSVTDIGLRLGYIETSSFSAAFRKKTGLTPTAYRRNVG